MRIAIISHHLSNPDSGSTGGTTYGQGFAIGWQRQSLGPEADSTTPYGAAVEDVIAAALDRLEYYQQGRFACDRNDLAIVHLKAALAALQD